MPFGSILLSTLLLSFGLTLFIAGLFGAYYGQGRSRSVGFVLTLVAVLLVGLFVALTWNIVPGLVPVFHARVVAQSMVAVLAATAGSLLAVGLFVLSVMKS